MFSKILSHTLFALIGAVAGGFVVTYLTYCIPDFGYIVRNSVKFDWSKEKTRTAFKKSLEYWSRF